MKTLILLSLLLYSCSTNRFYQKKTKVHKVQTYPHHYYCIETYHDNWYTKDQMIGRAFYK